VVAEAGLERTHLARVRRVNAKFVNHEPLSSECGKRSRRLRTREVPSAYALGRCGSSMNRCG